MSGRTIAIGDVHGCAAALRAVLEAMIGRPSAFIRTPKKGDQRDSRLAYRLSPNHIYVLEWLMGLWCLATTCIYFQAQHYLVGHFLLIYGIGFTGIGTLSWHHQRL